MAEIKVVINDPKTGKSYQKSVTDDSLIGKQIRDKVDGEFLGLKGYELQITGGSDNAGFPMRADIPGAGRKEMLLSKGPGVHISKKGCRVRKTVTGSTISERTAQVSVKVVKQGTPSLDEVFGTKEAPKEQA